MSDERGWRYGNPDDEMLPITRCICGATFKLWEMNISVYRDEPHEMPCCGRRVYFAQQIEIVEVPRG